MNSSNLTKIVEDPIRSYPATTVACFDATRGDLPRRELDEARNVSFLEKLASLGVDAVLIAASTGHGHLRDAAELEQWFRSAGEARLGRTVKMALLRPEDGEQVNRRLLALLRELSYQVVFVRPGTDLAADASDQVVADNMRPVVSDAARLDLAVGVYSIPDVSGLPLSVESVVSLLDGPGGERIVAAKVTESDYDASTSRYLRHPRLRNLKIVQGWDPFIARALRDGPRFDEQGRQRCGVTSGPMSLAIHQYLHILAAADRGEWEEVERAQSAATALFESMQDDPNRFADLQRAKYIMGLGKPLTGDVTPEQAERVFSALENLPRAEDRARLARSLDLMEDGPFHDRLKALAP